MAVNDILARCGISSPSVGGNKSNVSSAVSGDVDQNHIDLLNGQVELAEDLAAIDLQFSDVMALGEESLKLDLQAAEVQAIITNFDTNSPAHMSKREAMLVNSGLAASGHMGILSGLESWGETVDVVMSAEAGLESISDRAKEFWNWLVEQFYKFLDLITDALVKVAGNADRLKKRADSEAKKLDDYTGETKKDKVKVIVKLLTTDGKSYNQPTVQLIKGLTDSVDTCITKVQANADAAFGLIEKLVDNTTELQKLIGSGADLTKLQAIRTSVGNLLGSNAASEINPGFGGRKVVLDGFVATGTDYSAIANEIRATKLKVNPVDTGKAPENKEQAAPSSATDASKVAVAVGDLADACITVRRAKLDDQKYRTKIKSLAKSGEKVDDSVKELKTAVKTLALAGVELGQITTGKHQAKWVSHLVNVGSATLDWCSAAR